MLKISFTNQYLKDLELMYKIDKQILTLVLIRTGTYSDLFKKYKPLNH